MRFAMCKVLPADLAGRQIAISGAELGALWYSAGNARASPRARDVAADVSSEGGVGGLSARSQSAAAALIAEASNRSQTADAICGTSGEAVKMSHGPLSDRPALVRANAPLLDSFPDAVFVLFSCIHFHGERRMS